MLRGFCEAPARTGESVASREKENEVGEGAGPSGINIRGGAR